MSDRERLEARLDAALGRVKELRADGQRAENEALDLMIQIGTYSARQAEAERDAAVARAEAAEAALAAAKAEGRADERAQVVAFCNAVGHHGARDAIAAGLHWQRD